MDQPHGRGKQRAAGAMTNAEGCSPSARFRQQACRAEAQHPAPARSGTSAKSGKRTASVPRLYSTMSGDPFRRIEILNDEQSPAASPTPFRRPSPRACTTAGSGPAYLPPAKPPAPAARCRTTGSTPSSRRRRLGWRTRTARGRVTPARFGTLEPCTPGPAVTAAPRRRTPRPVRRRPRPDHHEPRHGQARVEIDDPACNPATPPCTTASASVLPAQDGAPNAPASP